MSTIKLQGLDEIKQGVFYEYDPDSVPLGEGAMGRVYKGRCVDSKSNTVFPVAVKAIFENIPDKVIERARREASVRIDSPFLLKMYGFIEMPFISSINGQKIHLTKYFVIMELLTGVTLYDFVQGNISDKDGEQQPAIKALHNSYMADKYAAIQNIVVKVLRGLKALHNANYIHRDIDPSNIMITAGGQVKLIDFGICKHINTLGTNDRNLTSTGVFMGKVNYAAPELVMGDVMHQGPSTDLYAMGILLFQLCTGHLPFSGSDNDVLLAHMRKPLPLKEVEKNALKKIIAKATEKSQPKRYKTAEQMLDDLENIDFSKHGGDSLKKAAGLFAVLAVIAVMVYSIKFLSEKRKPVEDPIDVVTVNGDMQKFKEIQKGLFSNDERVVRNAYQKLVEMAEKTRYNDAMFEYGLTLSVANEDFDIPSQRQQKLGIKPDIESANLWLRRSYEADNKSYRAVYWMLDNLIAKKQADESSVLLDEINDLIDKFDKMTAGLHDATAEKYKEAVNHQRKALSGWSH